MIKRIISYLYHLYNPTTEDRILRVVEEKVIVHTLSRESMDKLRARLPNTALTGSDSAEVASHKLGVQHALNELSKGFEV